MRTSRWMLMLSLLAAMPLAGCGDDKSSECEACTNVDDCESGLTCQQFARRQWEPPQPVRRREPEHDLPRQLATAVAGAVTASSRRPRLPYPSALRRSLSRTPRRAAPPRPAFR